MKTDRKEAARRQEYMAAFLARQAGKGNPEAGKNCKGMTRGVRQLRNKYAHIHVGGSRAAR